MGVCRRPGIFKPESTNLGQKIASKPLILGEVASSSECLLGGRENQSAKKGGVSFWNVFADAYGLMRPPLVPSPEEIAFLEKTAAAWAANHPGVSMRALLLGVTSKIATMRWPRPSQLVGVDASLAMVRQVWPGNVAGKRGGVCGDWLALPLPDGSCHVVVGDGSINCVGVGYPEGFRRLAEAIVRVLDGDGIALLRCYIRPDVRERHEDLIEAALHGSIPAFHELKFRFLLATQESVQEGLVVDEVYRAWVRLRVDVAELAARTGWDPAAIATMEDYRDCQTVFIYPTQCELHSALGEYFDEVETWTSASELGKRCPILVLRPRRDVRNLRGEAQ